MSALDKFSLLHTLLKALGLSPDAINEITARIQEWLEPGDKAQLQADFPYRVRDDFLSPAEHSFYLVLRTAIANAALICLKVSLGDLFYAHSPNPSQYRTCTNRIDRKHVDFLLCDPKTAKPLVGIELDDKSHLRTDRQTRDAFVEHVFAAAGLPLVRIPVRPTYSVVDLANRLRPFLRPTLLEQASVAEATTTQQSTPPRCPRCGGEMVLRTARNGANQGNHFWGCGNYPRCRGIVNIESRSVAPEP